MWLYEEGLDISEAYKPFRKQLIPDAFTVPPLPSAAGFESWLHTLITKVHAASQGLDAARDWIAKVKRDPDYGKYESADGFEALDIKFASALKGVLNRKLSVLITQKERTLEQNKWQTVTW